jgi:DNA polymerase zeta
MTSPVFNVRIVALDYYLAQPIPAVDVCFSPLEGTAIDQVPVIRIFGSTPSGQHVCVHVHKVRVPVSQ